MEVGIAVEVRRFLILKRVAYMHFLKFTQICTEICKILTWYKEYILHNKVRYCVCWILKTVEYGLTAFKVWITQLYRLYEDIIHLHKN